MSMNINGNLNLDLLKQLSAKTGIKLDENNPKNASEILQKAQEIADKGDAEVNELLYQAQEEALNQSSSFINQMTSNIRPTLIDDGPGIAYGENVDAKRPVIIDDEPGIEVRTVTGGAGSAADAVDVSKMSEEELKAYAFNFGKPDAPHNGSNLQTKFIIDKQYTWVFGIPQFAEPNHVEKGDADYQTGRLEKYVAQYNDNGVISKVTTSQKDDEGNVIYDITYDRTDDGYWTETVHDKVTNTVTQTYTNPDGTIEWHKEFASPESMESDRPEVERNYTYSFDENGNPVQTMKNNHDITVTTTYDVKTGEYTQVNSREEAQKAEAAKKAQEAAKAEAAAKAAEAAKQSRYEAMGKAEAQKAEAAAKAAQAAQAAAAAKAAEEAAKAADAAKQARLEELGKNDAKARELRESATGSLPVIGMPDDNKFADLTGLSDAEKIVAAFAYDGADAQVNGTELSAAYTIRVPEKDKLGLAETGDANSEVKGEGKLNGSMLSYTAKYDENGDLSSITFDRTKTRFEYSKDADGNMVESEIDYVGSTEFTFIYTYNDDHTLKSRVDYWNKSAKDNGRPSLAVDYDYKIDDNGNPVQLRISEKTSSYGGVNALTRQPDGNISYEYLGASLDEINQTPSLGAPAQTEGPAQVEEPVKTEEPDAVKTPADLSGLSDSEKIKAAFAYNGSDAEINGTKLQSNATIRVPQRDKIGLSDTGKANSEVKGESKLNGSTLKYTAKYDENGKLSSIEYDNGRTRFDYWNDEDGNFVECETNYVGSTEITYIFTYNDDNTLKSHVDFWDQNAKEKGRPSLAVEYSYAVDADGNPMQIRTSDYGINALIRKSDGTIDYEKLADSPDKLDSVKAKLEAERAEALKQSSSNIRPTVTGGAGSAADAVDVSKMSEEELKAYAFNFGKPDAPHNGSNLQTKFIIDKQYTWVFGIPQFAEPNHVEKGDADYQTGRLEKYVAQYNDNGVISKVTTSQKDDEGNVIYDITYDRTDDGYWTETVHDKVTNTVTQTYTNPDGTIEWHKEFASPESMESGRPEVERNYTYSFDENGNPVQTMKNNHGITVTTTYDIKTGEYTQVNSHIDAQKTEEPEKTEDSSTAPAEPPKDLEPEVSLNINGNNVTVDINDEIVDKTKVEIDTDKGVITLGPSDDDKSSGASSEKTDIPKNDALKDLFNQFVSMIVPGMNLISSLLPTSSPSYADTIASAPDITVNIDGTDVKINGEVASNTVINYNKDSGEITLSSGAAAGEKPVEKVEDKSVTSFSSDSRIKTDDKGNKYINVENWSNAKGNNGSLYSIMRNSYDLDSLGIKFGDAKFQALATAIMNANPEIYGSEDGKTQGRTRILDGSRANSVIHAGDKIVLPDAYDVKGLDLKRPETEKTDDSNVTIKVSAETTKAAEVKVPLEQEPVLNSLLTLIAVYASQPGGLTMAGISIGGVEFPNFTVTTEKTDETTDKDVNDEKAVDDKNVKSYSDTELRDDFDEKFKKFMENYRAASPSVKNQLAEQLNDLMNQVSAQMSPAAAQDLAQEYMNKVPQVQETKFSSVASSIFSNISKSFQQLASLSDSDDDDDEVKTEDIDN